MKSERAACGRGARASKGSRAAPASPTCTSRADSRPPRGTGCRSTRRCLAERYWSRLTHSSTPERQRGWRRARDAGSLQHAGPLLLARQVRLLPRVHLNLFTAISPQTSPDLPRSPHMSASSHASISPYLPISRASSSASPLSRSISPYLPISPTRPSQPRAPPALERASLPPRRDPLNTRRQNQQPPAKTVARASLHRRLSAPPSPAPTPTAAAPPIASPPPPPPPPCPAVLAASPPPPRRVSPSRAASGGPRES